jgi:adenylate kinase family enzyme
MERIMIIGCGGSGKTTLARILAEKTGLPLYHLDKIYWTKNWEHRTEAEFDEIYFPLLEKHQWILDGNFNRTISQRLERCDTVIYLDYNRFACLWGWLKRVITNWGRSRTDMGEGCKEWFDPEFAMWIWNFNKNHRKRYYQMLQDSAGKKIIILKNRREMRKFLKQI